MVSTPNASRRQFLVAAGAAATLGGGVLLGGPAAASSAPALIRAGRGQGPDRDRVRQWAADTWTSLVAMTDPATGLPADNITESLAAGDRSGYTSPTNIGGYMWSAIVARELGHHHPAGVLPAARDHACAPCCGWSTTARAGMYYNWYDESTGAVLYTFPASGDRIYPFLSSVDNGWLGAALMVVRTADRRIGWLADSVLADALGHVLQRRTTRARAA